MSKAKQLYVRESVVALKKLLSNRSVTISNRIRMLILIRNNEGESLSKQKLGKLLGVSSSSVQIWRKMYETGSGRFKKNFGRICRNIYEGDKEKYKQVNLYFQDESRFELFTKTGRMLTAKGIKPICSSHQEYSSTWLFGAFSPISGNDFMMEFPVCNTETLEISLFIDNTANEINKGIVISTCAYKYIFLIHSGMKYKSFLYNKEFKALVSSSFYPVPFIIHCSLFINVPVNRLQPLLY
ncbi:MAG: hypothetical protein LBH91_06655 [Prevotellaceae bacterium]|jgi:hypothetical protein|nr:hypothetical protein [Prevotellaceae bacterium]